MVELLIPTMFLKVYSSTTVFFAIIFTIYLIIKIDYNIDFKEVWFCGFKSVGYIILSLFIYCHYKTLDKMPVLDFFTFVLAAFEGAHNFVNSIGLAIAAPISLAIRNRKGLN